MMENSKKRPYTVNGKKMYFSQEEVEAILEKHILKESFLPEIFEMTRKPTDGKCFKVEIARIDISLFLKKRNNEQQEYTRKLILKAFKEALNEPEKYELFYLLIPEKEWVYGNKRYTSVKEQMNFAEKVGGYTSTWIEQALGWAQQITNDNGSKEVWKNICNNPEKIKSFRLLIWKDRNIRIVGGANVKGGVNPASYVSDVDFPSSSRLHVTVPLVTLKSLHCPLSNY